MIEVKLNGCKPSLHLLCRRKELTVKVRLKCGKHGSTITFRKLLSQVESDSDCCVNSSGWHVLILSYNQSVNSFICRNLTSPPIRHLAKVKLPFERQKPGAAICSDLLFGDQRRKKHTASSRARGTHGELLEML